MNMLLNQSPAAPTMSSLDLLEIVNASRREYGETDVRRNDFHARCADELQGEHYETFVVTNPNNTTTTAIRLTRDQCMYVLMRESKDVRRRVTARLNGLAQQAAPAFKIPQTLSEALRLAANQADEIERQKAELAAAAPKVEFVDRYATANGSKGFREVCKLLGANEREFGNWLMAEGIMYRLGGKLTPYRNHIDAGRFEIKAGVSTVNEHAFNQARFTPKGVTWIAGEWGKRLVQAA